MMRNEKNVVALGEATGHCHEMVGAGVEVTGEMGQRDLNLTREADIVHEEHDTIKLPPKAFETGIVIEKNHFTDEAEEVKD